MSNFNNGGLGDGGLSKSREKSNTLVSTTGIITGELSLSKLVLEDDSNQTPQLVVYDPKILADITAKEEECLRIIHTRYCIPRALKINVNDLSRLQPDSFNRPNYWEYYYRHGTPNEYFLMSREVAIIGGEVKLNISFNAELAREGE